MGISFIYLNFVAILLTMPIPSQFVTDWRNEFPILKKYTPTKIYLKTDLLLIGLSLEKLWGDYYRVYFNARALWGDDPVHRPMYLLFKPLKNERVLDFDIGFQLHDYYFSRAVECARSQFGVFLKERISLKDILEYIEKDTKDVLHKNHNASGWSRTIEFRIALGLYFNNDALIHDSLTTIEKEIPFWKTKSPDYIDYKAIETWVAQLYNYCNNRQAFMDKLHCNLEHPRFKRLNHAEIIYDLSHDYDFSYSRNKFEKLFSRAGKLIKTFFN